MIAQRIVIDCGVAIKWFTPEPLADEARALKALFETGALMLHAPDLIYSEFGNVIWKKQAFQGLSQDVAQQALQVFSALDLVISPAAELLGAAYHIAVARQRTVYDSLYIALSEREQCPFVTTDVRLVNATQTHHTQVMSLEQWHARQQAPLTGPR